VSLVSDRDAFRAEQQTRRQFGKAKQHEKRLENATYTAAEVKVLTETASKVALELGRREVMDLLADFVDTDDCWFDHHGYCQAHGWFRTDPTCPHARAKDLLDAQPPASGATSDATSLPSEGPGTSEPSKAAKTPQDTPGPGVGHRRCDCERGHPINICAECGEDWPCEEAR
jgi:hypothetical protein